MLLEKNSRNAFFLQFLGGGGQAEIPGGLHEKNPPPPPRSDCPAEKRRFRLFCFKRQFPGFFCGLPGFLLASPWKCKKQFPEKNFNVYIYPNNSVFNPPPPPGENFPLFRGRGTAPPPEKWGKLPGGHAFPPPPGKNPPRGAPKNWYIGSLGGV